MFAAAFLFSPSASLPAGARNFVFSSRLATFTRIFSDIHYGDRSSRVFALSQLRPLLDGPAALVLNGDTLDTRVGPSPARTDAMREEVRKFFPAHISSTTFLTGNHDADFTDNHLLDLGGGEVFVTHGDILYPDIVPWSQDAPTMRRRLADEFAKLPASAREHLATRFEVFRRVAFSIPQRHQSQRNPIKYAVAFAQDTVWPPSRFFEILRAWRDLPVLAEQLVKQHRPAAKFILLGHTHRPGIWRRPDGLFVINTGSFSRPLGGYVVDLLPQRLIVRRVVSRGSEFRTGAVVAEFPLASG
jgi:predicted phosphodiesterase